MTLQPSADRLWKDQHGRQGLWQTPNLPLITWFVCMVLGKVIQYGRWHELFSVVAFGAIFTWAWLEIFQGVSYARRLLGAIILIIAVYSRVIH